MEYHAPESDFEFKDWQRLNSVLYTNVITNYFGNRRNIIYPDTIDGKEVKKVDLVSENTTLTSAVLPDSCTNVGRKKYSAKDLIILVGEGLQIVGVLGKYFPALVQLDTPNALNVRISETNVRELFAPLATTIQADECKCLKTVYASSLSQMNGYYGYGYGNYSNCYSLEKLYAPNLKDIGAQSFWHCYKLRNFEMPKVEYIGSNAFAKTHSMTKIICPSLKTIDGIEPFCASNVRYLYAPNLEICSYPIGRYNHPEYTSKLIVSSKFTRCDRDAEGYDFDLNGNQYFYHHDLDIYGTPNTYAEEYASQFHLKFTPLPLLESEPEDMGHQSDSIITTDVLGFNKEYQWYGTTLKDNRLGVALEEETEETLDTSKYDYSYYYCIVKTHDGNYKKNIVTGTRKTLDMNDDGIIDIADLSILLHYYGEVPEEDIYDVNEDGIVDIQDITYLLYSTVYGTKE